MGLAIGTPRPTHQRFWIFLDSHSHFLFFLPRSFLPYQEEATEPPSERRGNQNPDHHGAPRRQVRGAHGEWVQLALLP